MVPLEFYIPFEIVDAETLTISGPRNPIAHLYLSAFVIRPTQFGALHAFSVQIPYLIRYTGSGVSRSFFGFYQILTVTIHEEN